MTTILGEKVSLIRPKIPYQAKVYKDERPQIKYNRRSKKIKKHCGKVIAICVKLVGDKIKTLPTPATHLQICEQFSIDMNKVIATGWQLDNGNFIWR